MPEQLYDVRINGVEARRIAHWIDRSGWDDGPWSEEPDLVEWTDAATGYDCLVLRTEVSGSLCGYVKLRPGHPLFGLSAEDVDTEEHDLRVHGGVTWARHYTVDPFQARPHLDAPPEAWSIGFDTSHHLDITPALDAMLRRYLLPEEIQQRRNFNAQLAASGSSLAQTYRDLSYVMNECAQLAHQLKEWEAP